ncbi:MAG: M28 family peptidase [Holophagaceae bacterium]|nr:M28 family peptidase [Holophagaceae bacterium]
MSLSLPFLLVLPLLAQAQAPAPKPTPPPAIVRTVSARPTASALAAAEARLRKDTAFLASPELKGRGNGEPGLEKAAEHILARYKALGLPTQVLRMPFPTAVERETAEASLNFGDGEARRPVWGKDLDAMWASGDGSFRFKALVFAGYGLGAPARQDLDGLDLKGKVVMMLREVPAAGAPHASPLETSPLARAKALAGAHPAAVIFLEEGPAVPAMARMDGAATLPFPMLAMTVDAAASVCADLKDRIAKLKATGDAQSRDYVFAPWSYLNLTLKLRRVEAQLPVVVASLKGRAKGLAGEYIAVGAHMDHLGTSGRHSLAGAARSEAHPGADDNASGTALVLELARALKARPAKRSILFMHFPGEEEGLLGSAYWMQHPTVDKAKVRFMANFDMVGRMDAAKPTLQLGAYGAPKGAFLRARTFAPAGLDVQGGDGLPGGGSDHMSFAAGRIPTFFFFTGLHTDYHRPSDTADKLNLKGMAQLAVFATDVVADLANAAEVPAFDAESAKPPKALGSPMRIAFGTLPDYAANPKGFRITGVSPGGTAEAIGLQGGDILTDFGGRALKDIQDYMAALGAFKPGDKVVVKWLRGETPMQAEAVLKGRP